MRWLLLLVSMAAFAVAFKSGTPGMLALALLVAFGALVASFLGFAAARIDAQAQTQMSRAATLVATSRGKAGLRGKAAPATTTTTTSGDGGTWTGGPGTRGQRGDDHDAGGDGGGDSGGGGDGGGGGGGD